MFHALYDLGSAKEIIHGTLEYGVVKGAVCHVSKRNAKLTKNLSCSHQTALAVRAAVPHGVRSGISGGPEKQRLTHHLTYLCNGVLCPEIAMRREDCVNFLFQHVIGHFFGIQPAVDQAFLIQEINIDKIDAHIGELLLCGTFVCQSDINIAEKFSG